MVTADDEEASAQAIIAGTGSLEGLIVTFSLSGAATGQFEGTTSHSGRAFATLTSLGAPGQVTVTASIVNPATGDTLTDSETLTVEAGSGDNEPNGGITAASRLEMDTRISGAIDAATDALDAYRVETTIAGTLRRAYAARWRDTGRFCDSRAVGCGS